MRGMVGIGGIRAAYEEPGRFGDPFAREHLPTLIYVLFHLRRFAGHADWTVGEHSLLVHDIVARRVTDPVTRLAALLHDLPEAYTGDIVGPLKTPRIAGIDRLWHDQLVKSFDLRKADWHLVKRADLEALRIEAEVFVHPDFWQSASEYLEVEAPPFSRDAVEALRGVLAEPRRPIGYGISRFRTRLARLGHVAPTLIPESPDARTIIERYLESEALP